MTSDPHQIEQGKSGAAVNNLYFVHSSSVVDEGAVVGAGSKIWHFCHICSGAVIGSNCILGQNIYVGNNVAIGDGVKIQNNVSVYDNVLLEDFVFCGPSCVFTNVTNPRSEVSRKQEFLSTVVRRGATLGANSTIVCGVEIGAYAFVGAGAVVTKDIGPFELVVGNPARRIGWMSRNGQKLDLPVSGAGVAVCPVSNESYRLSGEQLISD